MARWLQLDSKIINLDQVTIISPRKKTGEDNAGTNINFINGDGMYIAQSVDEVFRLIEAAEGPEPPKAINPRLLELIERERNGETIEWTALRSPRITDHPYEPSMGGVYECLYCGEHMSDHAR